MRFIGDKNRIYEDVFNFMISYLPFPQKSIRSELAKLFSISISCTNFIPPHSAEDNNMNVHKPCDKAANTSCIFNGNLCFNTTFFF